MKNIRILCTIKSEYKLANSMDISSLTFIQIHIHLFFLYKNDTYKQHEDSGKKKIRDAKNSSSLKNVVEHILTTFYMNVNP